MRTAHDGKGRLPDALPMVGALVVAESDVRFREALSWVLQAAGYDVVTPPGPCEVIRAILVTSVIALVTNDELLVDGEPLAAAARTARPSLTVIRISDRRSDGGAADGIWTLRRPFRRDTLLRLVEGAGSAS